MIIEQEKKSVPEACPGLLMGAEEIIGVHENCSVNWKISGGMSIRGACLTQMFWNSKGLLYLHQKLQFCQ